MPTLRYRLSACLTRLYPLVILVQAENEFSASANNSPYMQAIIDLYRENGIVIRKQYTATTPGDSVNVMNSYTQLSYTTTNTQDRRETSLLIDREHMWTYIGEEMP